MSADIDGLVSAAMLGSVAPNWEIVAFVVESTKIILHPSVVSGMPTDLVAVDLFSLRHDSLSNHVVKYGNKQIRLRGLRSAFSIWDGMVDAGASKHLYALPSVWAGTQGCYEDAYKPTSSKYKYPLGTAQILLAMLEAAGHAPKFFDRHYLPWLVANCDGGVSTYTKYGFNARIWWATMAGAVGPASLTEQVFRLVDTMRPHDFLDTVNALDRERQASGVQPWLNDDWNLAGADRGTLERALTWIHELTGWRDPVRGGISQLASWVEVPASGSGIVYVAGSNVVKPATEKAAIGSVMAANNAINANFYHGGFSGSRFNWVGGW
ncbi:hypothetical protein [Nocardioides ochotonae]|uniref:hypothetical protein n=1 Tax=Nocardioides ochotonae TaxID=2685869 RepID=UPI00140E6E18|nr:hypothetical protein [Nocardioides ochotonae]